MKPIALFLFAVVTGCAPQQGAPGPASITITSAMPDVTDGRHTWPHADQLLGYFPWKTSPEAEFVFRVRPITDKRLTPILTKRLATAETMEPENKLDDPQFRSKNILAFFAEVRTTMTEFYSTVDTTRSLSASEIFRNIASELTALSEMKKTHATTIVASDLRERSDLLDTYRKTIPTASQIAATLNKDSLLPENLSGITVIFLFNPRDRIEDAAFSHMVDAYKLLLQPRGAQIKVQANL